MPNHTLQVALSLLALPDFCCSSAFASVGFSFPNQRVVTPGRSPGTGDTGPGGGRSEASRPAPHHHSCPKRATRTWNHSFSWYLSWRFAVSEEHVSWRARTDFFPCVWAVPGAWARWERPAVFQHLLQLGQAILKDVRLLPRRTLLTHPEITLEGQICK